MAVSTHKHVSTHVQSWSIARDSAEDRRAYFGFIQAVIARLATASFSIKGFGVALATVIVGLTAKDNRADLAWITMIPAVAFWALDAYYVELERRYRDLFTEAVNGRRSTYDMRPAKFRLLGWIGSMLRPTVFPIYAGMLALAAIVMSLGMRITN